MKLANIPLLKGSTHNIPTLIVVHAMGEFIKYEGEDMYAPYFLRKIGLSAHILVTPNGTLIKCRHDTQGGYHAKGYNEGSLGIEFMIEGVHDYASFLEAMKTEYVSSKQLLAGIGQVRNWLDKYRLPIEAIKTHSELDPDRKQDPGIGFPLDEFKAMISHAS